MIINYLCPPALLYVVFFMISIVVELSEKKYKTAFTQTIICIIFTCILQLFCMADMSLLAWVLVFIPIIMYTYMVLIIFIVFSMSPADNKHIVVKK
jgi:ABC-type bacteriocin/lantibiotic exporter with double-glycine peptidase domain